MSIYAVLGNAQGEITEKKSRFIANVQEVHTEQEAIDFIDDMRRKYWDARHNCYAYVLGRNSEIQRFSDDKEPQGTAGKPILNVLTSSDVRNAVIVVTRYFGGVLLGTGGLVRAYSSAATAGLEALKTSENGSLLPVLEGTEITFSCEYKDISRFDALCASLNACTVSKEYLEKPVSTYILEADSLGKFMKEAGNITRGSFTLDKQSSVIYCRDGLNAIIYEF